MSADMYRGISRRSFAKGVLLAAGGAFALSNGLLAFADDSAKADSAKGAASASSDALKGQTITWGTVTTNTGTAASYGMDEMDGFNLAVKEVNANGGVAGAEVKLNSLDDKGDPTEASNAFNKLAGDDSVCAVLGPTISGTSTAVQPLADEHKVVTLAPAATSDSIKTGDYMFRVCFKDSYQGTVAARYAAQTLGVKKVAVLYGTSDPYSSGCAQAFKDACQANGLEVVDDESSSSADDTEYSAQLQKIAFSGAELLYAPYYYNIAGTYIIPQARTAGFEGYIMGPDGFDGIQNVMTGDASQYDKVYYTNHYSPDSDSERVKNFIAAFKKEYGDDKSTNFLNALAYDAVYMMKQAVEAAGSTDREAIHKAMTGMSFEGVTGKFTLDETGSPKKSVIVLKFEGGKPVYDSTVDPE